MNESAEMPGQQDADDPRVQLVSAVLYVIGITLGAVGWLGAFLWAPLLWCAAAGARRDRGVVRHHRRSTLTVFHSWQHRVGVGTPSRRAVRTPCATTRAGLILSRDEPGRMVVVAFSCGRAIRRQRPRAALR